MSSEESAEKGQRLDIIPGGFVESPSTDFLTKHIMKMSEARDHHMYHFKVGNKIVHTGITTDMERREGEHQSKWPKGHISQVGHARTRQGALDWEQDQRDKGKPTGP